MGIFNHGGANDWEQDSWFIHLQKSFLCASRNAEDIPPNILNPSALGQRFPWNPAWKEHKKTSEKPWEAHMFAIELPIFWEHSFLQQRHLQAKTKTAQAPLTHHVIPWCSRLLLGCIGLAHWTPSIKRLGNQWLKRDWNLCHPDTSLRNHESPGKSYIVNNWRFPEMGVPQHGWFIMESTTKMDDLGVPSFQETSKGAGWRKQL